MARQNVPFLAYNRGIVSPKALARVDLDRTRLSAEVMTNWLPKTQGAMTIRPGTKYLGSSLNDTGAVYVEFVASTDDVALPELTHQKMRIWLGSDAHSLTLLGRPKVDTTVALSDTGWINTSTGGVFATPSANIIPTMTSATTNGVTISASSQLTNGATEGNKSAWKAADGDNSTEWWDTGNAKPSPLPTWFNINFGSDTGAWPGVHSYTLRAGKTAAKAADMPKAWRLLTANYDTGTYATDTGKWILTDTQGSETDWAISETRTYVRPDADTGTLEPHRHWRLYFTQTNVPSYPIIVADIGIYTAEVSLQVKSQGGRLILNATAIGSLARSEKRVVVSDTGTEHSLAITIDRGPVTLRVGSTQRDDNYVAETILGGGHHSLSFTPDDTKFWITLQTDATADRIISSLAIGDSGTVEIATPWDAADLENIRYDQSADVVYVDCAGVSPYKIERRGTGRSWSVVTYEPTNGPFLPSASSSARLSVSGYFGNVTLTSDVALFRPEHVGALFRLFHNGQKGTWYLGASQATTDAIKITGISDTGTPGTNNERRITVAVSGSYGGRVLVERSYDANDAGFKAANPNFGASSGGDTGTFTDTIDDRDSNRTVWYRCRVTSWTTGVAVVKITYSNGSVTGILRITGYNSNRSVSAEVLSRLADTGATDNWQEGYWSEAQGYPTAVALHGGRLAHAQGGTMFLSVSDDYENFDEETEGDAAPIIRTLGSGPVDNIHYLVSLLRLIIGTAGAEITMRSSSLDEPLTPDNSSAVTFSTQGSANVRAIKMDTRAIMVQRSKQRVFMIGPAENTLADYESFELTLLVPDLLEAGIVSIAVQRQPDTRIHCVLANGKVGILTYEPQQEVICWSMWEGDTGTSPAVEQAVVLPGVAEDAVYYHVRRTINGATKRYLEKWALESECIGDTGLTWLMDCAKSYTDTGRTTTLTDIGEHLVAESVVVWSDDTGSIEGVDRSPDVNGVQTRYAVSAGGDVTLTATQGAHHAVAGLPFKATWKSAKLAYAAEAGTALAQLKRTDKIGFSLYRTHNNGLFFGNDTGTLDPLPRVIDGVVADADLIHQQTDQVAMPFPGLWSADARIVLQAKSPRPCTVLAAIPTVSTSEKV